MYLQSVLKLAALCGCVLLFTRAKAQTDADGIMRYKNNLCSGIVYQKSSWDHYWEGTFKRDNANLRNAAATVLVYLLPAKAETFNAMAEEASLSRLYGAIHYRSDCDQGAACGKRVDAFAVERAKSDGAN